MGSGAGGRTEESVVRTPIILGVYRLEGEDEDILKTHVVLNELRKVDALMVRFAERFRNMSSSTQPPISPTAAVGKLTGTSGGTSSLEDRRRQDGNRGGNSDSEAGFYGDVIVFLRRKLRGLVETLQREVRVELAD